MIDQLEFDLRASLCRQLAKREPANRIFWIAEAENWSRLSKERSRGAAEENIGSGIMASWREKSGRFLSVLA
jgi:hypothetical protein